MSRKTVALTIDEAQHSLTSDERETAMTAVKSARDQLSTPSETRLLSVMSGSDRDKLLRLANSIAAPFFGSAITRMAELDRNSIVHIAGLIERSYPRWCRSTSTCWGTPSSAWPTGSSRCSACWASS